MELSAQSYFDLANQQMHKGNCAAAAANYKRAWRIEENSAAAKGRLVRARRAMQVEKESIADRRQKCAQWCIRRPHGPGILLIARLSQGRQTVSDRDKRRFLRSSSRQRWQNSPS